ncbi:inner nuclear membrane protein enriched at telomere/subtelomere region [Blastocladiella emersonii ATCC 22665]|nr:inner nuclear membrane protein enriched at telomere/subtelomere region [Blastocladiella emersonii ATCC 22665]
MDGDAEPWLRDNFNVSQATKWDLERWITRYSGAPPPPGLRRPDLERLFNDMVYARTSHHHHHWHVPLTHASASAASPMQTPRPRHPAVPPENAPSPVATIRFNRAQPPPPAVVPPPAPMLQPRLPVTQTPVGVKWTPESVSAGSSSATVRRPPASVRRPAASTAPGPTATRHEAKSKPDSPDDGHRRAFFDATESVRRKSRRARPRDGVDFVIDALRILGFLALSILAASYILAARRAGYCSHLAVSVVEDEGATAASGTTTSGYRLSDLVGHWWPTCKPCPSHARCEHGQVVGCQDTHHVLRRTGWFGSGRACLPDAELWRSVDLLCNAAIQSIRAEAGAAQCLNRTTPGSPSSKTAVPWISGAELKSRLESLARAQKWPADRADVYVAKALPELLDTSTYSTHLRRRRVPAGPAWAADAESTVYVSAAAPQYPLVCRVRLATRAAAEQYWRQAALGVLAVAAAARLRARYRRREWLRAQAESVYDSVVARLQARDRGTAAGEEGEGGGASYLAVASVQQEARRQYLDRHLVSAGEWEALWGRVHDAIATDANVRQIATRHRGEVMECWEWIGFDALLSPPAPAAPASASAS